MKIILTTKVETFIHTLEKPTIAKMLRTIDLLQKFGNKIGMPYSKKIKQDLYELRTGGKQNIRLFYTFREQQIIILHGFIKKTQKLPRNEINVALSRIKGIDI